MNPAIISNYNMIFRAVAFMLLEFHLMEACLIDADYSVLELLNLAAQPNATLNEVESFVSYAGCGYTMTATAAVAIGNTTFPADLVTYTLFNPSQSLVVTFDYPGVTLSSLRAGDSLTFSHRATGTAAGQAPFTATPIPYTVGVPTQYGCLSTACNPWDSTVSECSMSVVDITDTASIVELFQSCICARPSQYESYAKACYACDQMIGNQTLINNFGEYLNECDFGYPTTTSTTSSIGTISILGTITSRATQSVPSRTGVSTSGGAHAAGRGLGLTAIRVLVILSCFIAVYSS